MRAWRIVGLGAGTVAACVAGAMVFELYRSQRADYGWRPHVTRPAFASHHPVVVVDAAHNNASTARFSSRYWPFAQLLRRDGYVVRHGTTPFSAEALRDVSILVVANAAGSHKPQAFGVNLPGGTSEHRDASPFTAAEMDAVVRWVTDGGALLLVSDHAPFGAASSALGARFGVTMHAGFTEVPGEQSDPLLFAESTARLGAHPILSGRAEDERVRRVMTFTGQSLDGPESSVVLLRLPPNAIEWIPNADSMRSVPAGTAQGLALAFGRGRVVVMGEAAALTAQVYHNVPFGMNAHGNDNEQFTLNVLHWLSRAL